MVACLTVCACDLISDLIIIYVLFHYKYNAVLRLIFQVIIKTTENMAANTNQLKRDIQQLLREEQDLKAEIQDLQRRISQREVGISIDSRTDALNSPEAASPPVSLPKMKKRLRITEKINEVKFTNQKVTTLSDGTQEHTADVTTGFIKFRISFKIDNAAVNSLQMKFNDPSQANELQSWINKCKENNDLQVFLRGVRSYAKWYEVRKSLTDMMLEDYPSYFQVQKSWVDGSYTITVKVDRKFLFDCVWKIHWDIQARSMHSVFTFKLDDTTEFMEDNKYLFERLINQKISPSVTLETWMRIYSNVINLKVTTAEPE